jgi:hypothetical protein
VQDREERRSLEELILAEGAIELGAIREDGDIIDPP